MMWLVTLIVLAVIAWFLFRMFRRNEIGGSAGRDPLEHDRDGLNQPLPGQRAATGGEIHDAARGHVGGRLEDGADGARTPDGAHGDARDGTATAGSGPVAAGGRPAADGSATAGIAASAAIDDGEPHRVEASVSTQPAPPHDGTSITEGSAGDAATLSVPGSPDPASADSRRHADDTLDAAAAARAAHETENTGGTGTAVLAGIATAAAAGAATAGAAAASARDDGSAHVDATDPSARVNPPDPDTAGSLDPEAGTVDRHDPARATDDTAPAGGGAGTVDATPAGTRDPARDDARTNAPVGDTTLDAAAREPLDDEPLDPARAGTATDAHASAPADDVDPSDRADPPVADTAGAGALADRSNGARSNLAAGTVTLGIGGASAVAGDAVLANGRTPAEQPSAGGTVRGADGSTGDTDRLAGGEARANVREMMKILNLRESDASRLDISKDDFARLWQGDGAAADSLVDDVSARLRRMLG